VWAGAALGAGRAREACRHLGACMPPPPVLLRCLLASQSLDTESRAAQGMTLFVMLVGRHAFNVAQINTLGYCKVPLAEAPGLGDPRWQELSAPARELVLAMLDYDPLKRLTAKQARPAGRGKAGPRVSYVETKVGPRLSYMEVHVGPCVSYVEMQVGPRLSYMEVHVGPCVSYVETQVGPRVSYMEVHVGPCVSYSGRTSPLLCLSDCRPRKGVSSQDRQALWLEPPMPGPAVPGEAAGPAGGGAPDREARVRLCLPRPQVLSHDWVATNGGAATRPLAAAVSKGAANLASLRRLRNMVHGAVALQGLGEQLRPDASLKAYLRRLKVEQQLASRSMGYRCRARGPRLPTPPFACSVRLCSALCVHRLVCPSVSNVQEGFDGGYPSACLSFPAIHAPPCQRRCVADVHKSSRARRSWGCLRHPRPCTPRLLPQGQRGRPRHQPPGASGAGRECALVGADARHGARGRAGRRHLGALPAAARVLQRARRVCLRRRALRRAQAARERRGAVGRHLGGRGRQPEAGPLFHLSVCPRVCSCLYVCPWVCSCLQAFSSGRRHSPPGRSAPSPGLLRCPALDCVRNAFVRAVGSVCPGRLLCPLSSGRRGLRKSASSVLQHLEGASGSTPSGAPGGSLRNGGAAGLSRGEVLRSLGNSLRGSFHASRNGSVHSTRRCGRRHDRSLQPPCLAWLPDESDTIVSLHLLNGMLQCYCLGKPNSPPPPNTHTHRK
jgi:hypothetical protein